MVHVDSLPDAVLDQVAQGLGGKLQMLDPKMTGVRVGLAESFRVWLLKDAHGGETLEELATPTPQWHHQIHTMEGRVVAFARSIHPPVGEDDIPALVRSGIAARLDDTFEWLDEHAPDLSEVRLLVVPTYHLHAFWIISDGESSVAVSDFPEESLALEHHYLYPEREFLAVLKLAEPITGVHMAYELADG